MDRFNLNAYRQRQRNSQPNLNATPLSSTPQTTVASGSGSGSRQVVAPNAPSHAHSSHPQKQAQKSKQAVAPLQHALASPQQQQPPELDFRPLVAPAQPQPHTPLSSSSSQQHVSPQLPHPLTFEALPIPPSTTTMPAVTFANQTPRTSLMTPAEQLQWKQQMQQILVAQHVQKSQFQAHQAQTQVQAGGLLGQTQKPQDRLQLIQAYLQQQQQQQLREQHQRRSSISGSTNLIGPANANAPMASLDSSSTLASSSSSTQPTLTTPPTAIYPPADPNTKTDLTIPAHNLNQLSDLVAQKVFEALARAGFGGVLNHGVGAGLGKGKERATTSEVDADAHGGVGTTLNAPERVKGTDSHMVLLVRAMKEMRKDVKGMRAALGVGSEGELDDARGGNDGVIVLDHDDDDDDNAVPALGAWRTRVKDRKNKNTRSAQDAGKQNKRGILQRLESLEMDVQEVLEKVRDPLAGVEGVFTRTGGGLGGLRHEEEGLPVHEASSRDPASAVSQQQQLPTIIDLTESPSRDGTASGGVGAMEGGQNVENVENGVGPMVVDVDGDRVQQQEKGEEQANQEGDQAMEVVGGDGSDEGRDQVRVMQVDAEITTPNGRGEGGEDVFGPLTPNLTNVSDTTHFGIPSAVGNVMRESSVDARAIATTTNQVASSWLSTSPVPVALYQNGSDKVLSLSSITTTVSQSPDDESRSASETSATSVEAHSQATSTLPKSNGKELVGEHQSPLPQPGSGVTDARLKISLSPKVTLVVESPPHVGISRAVEAPMAAAETPPPPPPHTRSATPPPGFSPVDWAKVSTTSRSRSGSLAGVGTKSALSTMKGTRSLRSSSASLGDTKTDRSPILSEVQKLVLLTHSKPSTPVRTSSSESYTLPRPAGDTIAALRMEVRQSPRLSPGMIVLEGSTSSAVVERKRVGSSPLGRAGSALSSSPQASVGTTPLPQPKVLMAAPTMEATASTSTTLSALTPLPTTTTTSQSSVLSTPKVAPATSFMSVDSPSPPKRTRVSEEAEDLSSPSPSPSPTPVATPDAVSASSSDRSSPSVDMPSSPHISVVSSIAEERDVGMEPNVRYGPPSRKNPLNQPCGDDDVFGGDLTDLSEDDVGEGVGVQEDGMDEEEEEEEEEEEDKEEEEEEEEECLEASLQLDEEEGQVGVADDLQQEYKSAKEEEGVTGPPSEVESSTALTMANNKPPHVDDDEEEEEKRGMTQDDEEDPLVGDDAEPREEDELSLSEEEAAKSSPSASQSASQAGFRSSSPSNNSHSSPMVSSPNAYSSSVVSSLTINPNDVDFANVRFGPPRKKVLEPPLSQSTAASADCEAVVQSLVMEEDEEEHRSDSLPALSHHNDINGSATPKTAKVHTVDMKFAIPRRTKSPEYMYVPSASATPIKKPSPVTSTSKGKEKEKEKVKNKPLSTVISIDASDDEVIITGRSRRGRPPSTRPILTKPPVKLELFDGPGPIAPSNPIQQDVLQQERPSRMESPSDLGTGPPTEPPRTPKRSIDSRFHNNLSPLSDLTPSPKRVHSPPFDPKKHAARLDDDDDTEVRPVKKKRKVSVATSVATTNVGSETNMKLDPDRSSAAAKAPPTKRLLLFPKKGQSMAVTRVKKRKNRPEADGDDKEPPLKKALLRKSAHSSEASTKSRESSKGKEMEKVKERPVRSSAKVSPSPAKRGKLPKNVKEENSPSKKTLTRHPRGHARKSAVVWPTCSEPNYDQHLQCDICLDWFHLGCVGVLVGDIRLEETEIFTCPPCDAGYGKERKRLRFIKNTSTPKPSSTASPSKKAVNSISQCARPDCQANTAPDANLFEVEAIVGMSGSGASALYLVKWKGYGYNEVTIQTLESMELSDPSILLETFYKAAKAERLDLKPRKNGRYALLKATAMAGWNSQGVFVKSES